MGGPGERAGRQARSSSQAHLLYAYIVNGKNHIMCGHPIAKIIIRRFKHQDKRQHCLKAIMYILCIGNSCLDIDGVKTC